MIFMKNGTPPTPDRPAGSMHEQMHVHLHEHDDVDENGTDPMDVLAFIFADEPMSEEEERAYRVRFAAAIEKGVSEGAATREDQERIACEVDADMHAFMHAETPEDRAKIIKRIRDETEVAFPGFREQYDALKAAEEQSGEHGE